MGNRLSSWSRWTGFVLIVLGLWLACTTKRTMVNQVELPPQTHLFLQFSDTLRYPGESTSMQVLHWYGDDPDGEVVGYEWAWDDTSAWTYTTRVSDTFYVPIRVPQDTFTFFIRAVDNDSLRDPTPDHMAFPIRNSPPTVSFPVDFVRNYSRTVYTCFSYFSIGWRGSDPDGDATITRYEWYLADSSVYPRDLDTVTWNYVDSLTTLKIFTDLSPGSYRFFLRCRDVAAAYSSVVFYPDTTAGAAWNVMEPHGSVLYVDDNSYYYPTDSVNINGALTDIYGPDGYSTWDVTARVSYYPRDITETLKLFHKVVWNGRENPHFKEAATSITEFLAQGGHLFAFSTHARADTTIYPFLPMDSVTTRSIPRIFNIMTMPGASAGYPDSLISRSPLSYSFGFRPGTPWGLMPQPVEALYYSSISGSDTVKVAARYPASSVGPAQVVYFSLFVFDCNEFNRFYQLMRFILEEEFENAGR